MLSSASRVGAVLLSEEVSPFDLIAVKSSGDVDIFATNDGNVLSVHQFLGQAGSKAAQEVTLCIDSNNLLKLCCHIISTYR